MSAKSSTAQLQRYSLGDFDSDNSCFVKVDLICNLSLLKDLDTDFCCFLANHDGLVDAGYLGKGEVAVFFIDTPNTPDAMRSVIQIISYKKIAEAHVSLRVGFGLKLRNIRFRDDFRDENVPAWWRKALEYAESLNSTPLKKAMLLYSDVLVFYDNLISKEVLYHAEGHVAHIRYDVFTALFTFILKKHSLFETEAPLFSTQVKKSVVTDASGQKIKHCENCKQASGLIKLLNCGKCQSARYCNRECQTEHWPEHRPFCKAIREEREVHGGKEVPKHVALAGEDSIQEYLAVGTDPNLAQVHDLFKHTCFHCYGWANDPSGWEKQAVFCSRACARKHARK